VYGISDTVYGFDRRWLALAALCGAQLLIFLDATVVNVALPTIERSLAFDQRSLSWVVNAYLVTFGGTLLLAGRAGDVLGRRRLLIAALTVFTLASLGCAVADSQLSLIVGRGVQGLAGAGVSAIGLAMIVALFKVPADRARALAIFSSVASAGGTLGVVCGGALAQLAGWRAIFLVNLPLGVILVPAVAKLTEPDHPALGRQHLDLGGAAAATASVVLLILTCMQVGSGDWARAAVLAVCSGGAALLLGAFERRAATPLVPADLVSRAVFTVPNLLAALVRASMFAWFFFTALYMQHRLRFSPLETGLGFLPATLLIGVLSYWATARIVRSRGVRLPFVLGALLSAAGLVSYAAAPVNGSFAVNVLPGMLLLGAGGGLLFMPLVFAATSSVPTAHAGLASGVLSTAQQLGGALGLAALAALAGPGPAGWHRAFLAAAGIAALAALVGALWLRSRPATRLQPGA
jgi:MFS family permease